ncbi:MAG: hypothetical protein ABEI96_06755 [Haloarculaceae archaeon]
MPSVDAESTLAMLWLVAGTLGPAGLIYGTVQVVGLEVDSPFDLVFTSVVVLVSLVWMTYCTWRIRTVSDRSTPAIVEWGRSKLE